MGYQGAENKSNKNNKNGKTRPSNRILSMLFLSLKEFYHPGIMGPLSLVQLSLFSSRHRGLGKSRVMKVPHLPISNLCYTTSVVKADNRELIISLRTY